MNKVFVVESFLSYDGGEVEGVCLSEETAVAIGKKYCEDMGWEWEHIEVTSNEDEFNPNVLMVFKFQNGSEYPAEPVCFITEYEVLP